MGVCIYIYVCTYVIHPGYRCSMIFPWPATWATGFLSGSGRRATAETPGGPKGSRFFWGPKGHMRVVVSTPSKGIFRDQIGSSLKGY